MPTAQLDRALERHQTDLDQLVASLFASPSISIAVTMLRRFVCIKLCRGLQLDFLFGTFFRPVPHPDSPLYIIRFVGSRPL